MTVLETYVEKEIWKPIKYDGFEIYQVSSWGRIRSIPRILEYVDGRTRRYKGYIRRLAQDVNGFVIVTLHNSDESVNKTFRVHKLVAEHFMTKPSESRRIVHHIDGDRTNNHISNLMYIKKIRKGEVYI